MKGIIRHWKLIFLLENKLSVNRVLCKTLLKLRRIKIMINFEVEKYSIMQDTGDDFHNVQIKS